MNSALSILTVLFLAYIGFGSLLYFGQRAILYYPTPLIPHDFQEETLTTDESIRVIVVNPGRQKAVLYFGGNGDAMAYNAPDLSISLPSHTVYLVNYRGYGGSSGSPSETGLYTDALFTYDAVVSRHNSLSVIGRSLGSAVATYVAAHRNIDRLILVTPLDSVVSMASRMYPIYPASLLVKDKYDSVSRAQDIEASTLVLIAENDRIIPRAHSENLVKALGSVVAQSVVLEDVDHNSISLHPDYYDHLSDFLNP